MFKLEQLKQAFKLSKGGLDGVAFDDAEVDGNAAALVTVVGKDNGKVAQRVFTAADMASAKLGAQIETFRAQVAS